MSEMKDTPLRVNVEDGELVIRVGCLRLNGHELHPTIPELKFDDMDIWVADVINELENSKEDGSTPLTDLFDKCINEAIEMGSIGLAEDSPVYYGYCSYCEEDAGDIKRFGNITAM